MSTIEGTRGGLIDAFHDLGERHILRLDQQRDVTSHEHAGGNADFGAVLVKGERREVVLKTSRIL